MLFLLQLYSLFALCRICLQFINFVCLVGHSHVQYTSTPAVEQSRRKATRLFEDSLSSISSQSDVDVRVISVAIQTQGLANKYSVVHHLQILMYGSALSLVISFRGFG